jgi:pyridoxine 4-dehydrogenase
VVPGLTQHTEIPIEEQMKTMAKLRDEGLFGHIGLSEVAAETIRRANKITSIASVEVEYSMFETTIEDNGVLAVCEELAIPIFAYSVTGKGMLTGTLKKRSDLAPDDIRLHQDRFSEEVRACVLCGSARR